MSRFFHDPGDLLFRCDIGRSLQAGTVSLWMDVLGRSLNLTHSRRVLDLGCGSGRFSVGLRERFQKNVIAIDPSPTALAHAQRVPGISYLQGVAESIPLADASIDMVFMSNVWTHLQDKEAAGVEIHRVLRMGGMLAIRTSTIETIDSLLYLCFFPSARAVNQKVLPTRMQVIQWASRLGFNLSHRSTIQQPVDNHLHDYAHRIALRSSPDLKQLSDPEFYLGLQKLQQYCLRSHTSQPVVELVDFFVFRQCRS